MTTNQSEQIASITFCLEDLMHMKEPAKQLHVIATTLNKQLEGSGVILDFTTVAADPTVVWLEVRVQRTARDSDPRV